MKAEATLTALASAIAVGFVVTRNAYLMGAMVFVATPLWLISMAFYLRRVLKELRERDVL